MRLNSIIFAVPLQITVLFFVTFVVFTGLKCEAAEYDVIILGAGLSGITAAKHLHENGIKSFVVLEAQDYVGGRLKNTNIEGITFGEGANWIHYVEDGVAGNPLLKLFLELKLKGHESNEDDVAVKPEGNKDAYEEAVKNIDLVAKEVQKCKQQQQDEPLRSAFQANGWRADTAVKSAVEWFSYDYEYAVKTDMMSTRRHDGLPQENIIVTDPRGYAEVINYLTTDFNDKIKTNMVIKTITENLKTGKVELTIEGKETIIARYVLCTFSTGVLGSNLVTFEPELPMWKKQAIARIPLAYYTHVLVKFPNAFWDNKEFLIAVGGEVRAKFPGIYNINKANVHEDSNNLLLFTAVGDDSLRIENQEDEKTIDEVMETLKMMYPNEDIPKPTTKDIFISKWSTNRYIQGSYSNAVVGSKADDFANLMGRVGNVFFAGEACDKKFWGYLQGAFRTGLAQAKVIEDCVKGKECLEYEPKLI